MSPVGWVSSFIAFRDVWIAPFGNGLSPMLLMFARIVKCSEVYLLLDYICFTYIFGVDLCMCIYLGLTVSLCLVV